jgi:hypothetical protein
VVKPFARVLLAFAALLLFVGGLLHAIAFNRALSVLSAAPMPRFYSGSFKALWLIDSATLVSLAGLFTYIAARPSAATRWVVVLLALIPAATAILIYGFVGAFPPAYLFIAAAAAVVVAGREWHAG